MKSKLRKAEQEDLELQPPAPDDVTLPKPPGRVTPSRRKVEQREAAKLAATKRFGGLVPERVNQQYWACSACAGIYDSREKARDCCRAHANRIEVCAKGIHRLADCTCPKRGWS